MSEDAVVIGGFGVVGTALSARLRAAGRTVRQIGRGDSLPHRAHDIFYCAGLTSDFRERPFATIDAHVSLINEVLRDLSFDRLVYLSSTRVYLRCNTGSENERISVLPNEPEEIYNLSKLTGEAICLRDPKARCKVARLSNVFGGPHVRINFLGEVISDAKANGTVHIASGRSFAKDYVSLDDAVTAILRIPDRSLSRIVYIASGEQVTNEMIGIALEAILGATVTYAEGSASGFPAIDTFRMRTELDVLPRPFAAAFMTWLRQLI